jgi:hypothetical protein
MFSVVKVREGIGADDYSDSDWYKNPFCTQAYEWTSELPEFNRNDNPKTLLTKRKT